MNAQPVAVAHLLTASDPDWLDSFTPDEKALIAYMPEIWRPGLTPAETEARASLARALEALDAGTPAAAAAELDNARRMLATQAQLSEGAA